jgi:hypothetical protein
MDWRNNVKKILPIFPTFTQQVLRGDKLCIKSRVFTPGTQLSGDAGSEKGRKTAHMHILPDETRPSLSRLAAGCPLGARQFPEVGP